MARTHFRPGQEVEARLLNHFHDAIAEAIRQLRLALGTGFIFYGFHVELDRATGLLTVSPGLAFDGSGQVVTLDNPLPVPPPDTDSSQWLCLRHHTLVDERDLVGRPVRERDSVEVAWLPAPPRDGDTVPLARVHRGPAGWLVDRSVARRAPTLAHRHTNETLPDLSGRLRYDGSPVRLTAPGGEEQRQALGRLENAVSAEFAKVQIALDRLTEQQGMQGAELEELRGEVAEAVEGSRPTGATPSGDALAALREELALMAGEDLRAEVEQLRAEVLALAQRPAGAEGSGLGSFTPINALHGVGEKMAQKLRDAGIQTVGDLLRAAANPDTRARVEETGLGSTRLKRWGREADLLRLYGAGPKEVALLLDGAGITGTATLALAEPQSLGETLHTAAQKRGDIAPPTPAWVESWIEQARRLPPVAEW